ncbi:mucin-2 isoform X2 [Etheostoma spectabile]|uniref:mucin-2 isoform X2 n=1 Tax=Etheostoma spectabile TaxID=54343 RepID=UPI0013AF65D8|nr:mucin-2-like isoform X2 [Etheostoma spectabile]
MSLALLLLLISSAQATHFYGTVMTYYPKNTDANGSVKVVLRYKLGFHTCSGQTWTCHSGDCGNQTVLTKTVDQESSGPWCQTEGIMTRQVPSNAPFQLLLSSGDWINNVQSILSWSAVTLVELRNRSDIGRANTSPQTTILPLLIVPSNCQREFNLLAFDPDGDEVRCRYGDVTLSECATCTPPTVLNLSSSCTLSFSPTLSSNEGAYVVQLVMEDFPRQTLTLTQTNGSQTTVTTNTAISKIPLQFAVRVGPAAPSCTEGLYLPLFLSPTPANRAQLYTRVNQVLQINISVVAANVSTFQLLVSGPYNVIRNTSETGQYTLKWTPSENKDGESHPICFVVQAVSNSVRYHSELRCVIVNVGNDPTSPSPTSTTTPSTTNFSTTTPLTTPNITTPNITTTPSTTNLSTTTPLTTPNITTTPSTTNFSTTTPLTTPNITTTPSTTNLFNNYTIDHAKHYNHPIYNQLSTTTPLTTPNITTTPSTTNFSTTTPLTTPNITTPKITTTQSTTNFSTTTPVTIPATNTTTNTPTITPQQNSPPPATTPVTSVSNHIVILRLKVSSPSPLSEVFIRSTVLQQIKDELVNRGLPSNTIVRLVSTG